VSQQRSPQCAWHSAPIKSEIGADNFMPAGTGKGHRLVCDARAISAPPIAATGVQGALTIVFTAGAVAVAVVVIVEPKGYAVMAMAEVTAVSITGPESKATISGDAGAAVAHGAPCLARRVAPREAGAATSMAVVAALSL